MNMWWPIHKSFPTFLQETLRSCLEVSLVPAFERSCQEMFMQVDGTFQRGMADHTAKAQQQFASSHSTLATTLKVETLPQNSNQCHRKLRVYLICMWKQPEWYPLSVLVIQYIHFLCDNPLVITGYLFQHFTRREQTTFISEIQPRPQYPGYRYN